MSDPKKPPAPATGLIANPKNDITIPQYSTVLRPIDETLLHRGGGKGIELYREVLKDGRTYTVLQKRKRKFVARDWTLTPASTTRLDKKAAAVCEAQLLALNLDRAALGLLDATLMGFTVGEIVWERDGAEIVASRIASHDQRRFLFDGERNLRLLTWEALAEGVPTPERKFIVHRFEDLSSDPFGWGLGRILFWHVLFKREGVAFWMRALERFATPLPVAKYPIGTLPEAQSRLELALSGAIASGALVVPAGTDIEFAQAAVSGTLTHEDWCRYWDEQTAETVLGQTLSTNIGKVGSHAAADTHQKTEDELIDGDSDLLGATLRDTLLTWITEYNCPGARPPILSWPRAPNIRDEEEVKRAKAERRAKDLANLKTARGMGWAPVDEQEHVAEIMGVEVVAVAPPPPPPGLAGNPPGAPPAAAPPAFAEPIGDQADDADALEQYGEAAISGWIAAVRDAIDALIAEGGSLADLPRRLLALYPTLDAGQLSGLIAAALTNAELRGRADVMDEGA